MTTIEERVQGFCKRCRNSQPYCPCTPKEQQNCLIYDAYIQGATEQQELDNKQLCEMVLDNQNAMVDIALNAYCEVECQRKEGMPCAHLNDGGCTNYRKFKKLMKGGKE